MDKKTRRMMNTGLTIKGLSDPIPSRIVEKWMPVSPRSAKQRNVLTI
jgi:hypothetical protein